MGKRIEQLLSAILTGAAVMLAVVAARREFFTPRTASLDTGGHIEYLAEWRSMLPIGVQLGNPAGPIKLIEFADLECPACRGFHLKTMEEVLPKYHDKVSITFVHYPLAMHRFSKLAAQAAECAADDGRFAEFVAVAYKKQDSLGLKSWGSYGKEAGVNDTVRFSSCAKRPTLAARIDSGLAAGARIAVRGTPTVVVNGWLYTGAPTAPELTRLFDDVLAGRDPSKSK